MKRTLYLILTIFWIYNIYAWDSAIVYYAAGKLTYVSDAEGNRIPDFSYAGYKGGCEPLPNVPVKLTITPVTGDNTANIQNAINTVGAMPMDANGIRGAVLLAPGTYNVSGSITVNFSGVVLRGSGNGTNPATSSIIYGVGDTPHQRTLVVIGGGTNTKWSGEVSGTQVNITDNFLPVGSKVLTLADVTPFSVGDNIIIVHPSTQEWLDAILGGETGSDPSWTPGQVDIKYNTYITAIDTAKKKITIASPIFEHFDKTLSQCYIYKYNRSGIITNVGIENLRVDNDYAADDDENHVWDSIQFIQVEDAWAKNVVTIHFGHSGFMLSTADRVTITDCQALDPISITTGERKYNFNTYTACSNILVKNCTATNGRHMYMSNGTSTVGGIVFYNCTISGDLASSEGHRMWSQGMLYDNIVEVGTPATNYTIGLYNRGDYGTSHGWAASHCVLWNCDLKSGGAYIEKPPTSQNYAIGVKTTRGISKGPFNKTLGYVEGTNMSGLNPASLYMAQLSERCGTPTFTPTNTVSFTLTSTRTNTLTSTRTFTNTSTFSLTNTQTFTATQTRTSTATATNTPTNTRTNTQTSTATATSTNTTAPTNTITNTATNTRTNTITNTVTNTSTNTPLPTNTATSTRTNTITSTATATNTNTLVATSTPTNTGTNTGTNTATATSTNTQIATNTRTFTITNTPTNTNTATVTGTQPPTWTQTNTHTATFTLTNTATGTNTLVATSTPTSTPINTPTNTGTNTATNTNTVIPTNTAINTTTSSNTFTNTPTTTPTSSFTYTFTPTQTSTNTSQPTFTFTRTATKTNTITYTMTPTNTAISTATQTEVETGIEEILVYPNPVAKGDDLKIRVKITNKVEKIKVKIWTVGFRLIMQEEEEGRAGENVINIGREKIKNLANGTYYYVIIIEDKDKKINSKIKQFMVINCKK